MTCTAGSDGGPPRCPLPAGRTPTFRAGRPGPSTGWAQPSIPSFSASSPTRPLRAPFSRRPTPQPGDKASACSPDSLPASHLGLSPGSALRLAVRPPAPPSGLWFSGSNSRRQGSLELGGGLWSSGPGPAWLPLVRADQLGCSIPYASVSSSVNMRMWQRKKLYPEGSVTGSNNQVDKTVAREKNQIYRVRTYVRTYGGPAGRRQPEPRRAWQPRTQKGTGCVRRPELRARWDAVGVLVAADVGKCGCPVISGLPPRTGGSGRATSDACCFARPRPRAWSRQAPPPGRGRDRAAQTVLSHPQLKPL